MKTTKEYIKPNVDIVSIKIESLLQSNSVESVSGLDGVDTGGEFGGGAADARGGGWFGRGKGNGRSDDWADDDNDDDY